MAATGFVRELPQLPAPGGAGVMVEVPGERPRRGWISEPPPVVDELAQWFAVCGDDVDNCAIGTWPSVGFDPADRASGASQPSRAPRQPSTAAAAAAAAPESARVAWASPAPLCIFTAHRLKKIPSAGGAPRQHCSFIETRTMTVITNIEGPASWQQKRVPRMFYDHADSGSWTEAPTARTRRLCASSCASGWP